jgi:two-component system, OmpR family, KDP operon response regulator KdpE
MKTLLLIDDEPDIHRVLKPVLATAGWRVIGAQSAAQGLRAARSNAVRIVLLDLGLPDVDGKEIIAELQSLNPMSIIVVSARHQDVEKVAALDAGADDFVDKPFSIGELLARIRAAERRPMDWTSSEGEIESGPLLLNTSSHIVELNGESIKLSPKEFALLRELMSHVGQVVTHRRLLIAGWGDVATDPQYLRSYIGLVRQKLEEDPSEPQLIRTEPGVGYRLVCDL